MDLLWDSDIPDYAGKQEQWAGRNPILSVPEKPLRSGLMSKQEPYLMSLADYKEL